MSMPIKYFLDQCIPPEHRWKIDLFMHWKEIIGPLEERVSIQKIDAETLYLSVYHPAWAQEIALMTPRLKRSINRLFTEPKVKHIRFCAQTQHPQQRVRTDEKSHKSFQQIIGPEMVSLTNQEQKALSTVHNHELTSALINYLNRCKSMQRR